MQQIGGEGVVPGLVLYHISERCNTPSLGKFGIEIYPADVRVRVRRYGKRQGGGIRGKIVEFSNQSRQRLLFAAFNARCDWQSFFTLTYPNSFPTNGLTVKEHLHALLASLRRQFDDLDYLWALEFQERGAPHFHALTSEFIPKDWLSRRWFEVVDSGDLKHLRAGTSIEDCSDRRIGAGYMAKVYGAKHFQKQVPDDYMNVGRFWGTSRGLVVPNRQVELPDSQMSVVRTLRRYAEKKMKQARARKQQPMVKGKKRDRAVLRPPRLAHVHSGLRGFTVFNGAAVADRLIREIVGSSD